VFLLSGVDDEVNDGDANRKEIAHPAQPRKPAAAASIPRRFGPGRTRAAATCRAQR
jgi:hypothetical protein